MSERDRTVRRVLWAVLGLNLGVALAKAVAGWWAGSLMVLCDAAHSALDAIGSGLCLVAVIASSKPPDREHPYGHRKYEYLAALALTGLLFTTCFELVKEAAERLLRPEAVQPHPTATTLIVLLGTLAVNVGVTLWERRVGRRLASRALLVDAAHTLSDVFVTISVIGGIFLVRAGWLVADALVSFGIAVIILRAGWEQMGRTLPMLVDQAPFDPTEVRGVVLGVSGVRSVHGIRSRGTEDHAFLEMHLVVGTHDAVEAHAITESVERGIRDRYGLVDVTIHVEPHERAG